jgi:hypothetical protein
VEALLDMGPVESYIREYAKEHLRYWLQRRIIAVGAIIGGNTLPALEAAHIKPILKRVPI